MKPLMNGTKCEDRILTINKDAHSHSILKCIRTHAHICNCNTTAMLGHSTSSNKAYRLMYSRLKIMYPAIIYLFSYSHEASEFPRSRGISHTIVYY